MPPKWFTANQEHILRTKPEELLVGARQRLVQQLRVALNGNSGKETLLVFFSETTIRELIAALSEGEALNAQVLHEAPGRIKQYAQDCRDNAASDNDPELLAAADAHDDDAELVEALLTSRLVTGEASRGEPARNIGIVDVEAVLAPPAVSLPAVVHAGWDDLGIAQRLVDGCRITVLEANAVRSLMAKVRQVVTGDRPAASGMSAGYAGEEPAPDSILRRALERIVADEDIGCGGAWCIAVAKEALATSGSPTSPETWQPIDTAPKDGTEMLVWTRGICERQSFIHIARFDTRDGWEDISGFPTRPTHWMLLPSPPSPETEKDTSMNRYRVDLTVAGNAHVRAVRASSAGNAAHMARKLVTDDGWLPEHIGHVKAENEADPHDYWESKPLPSPPSQEPG